MKLKKPETASAVEEKAPTSGGATIAARFQLDADPREAKKGPAGVGRTNTQSTQTRLTDSHAMSTHKEHSKLQDVQ